MPIGGCFLLKGLGPWKRRKGGQERGRKHFTIRSLSSAPCWGGRARTLQGNKEAVWPVTVRGKHMATNGAVMGGEETWEKLVQESWHINSGGVTSPLAGGQGPLFHPPHRCSGSQD